VIPRTRTADRTRAIPRPCDIDLGSKWALREVDILSEVGAPRTRLGVFHA
jgi:hypothetical protein